MNTPDMNDPWTLSAYKRMLLFENDFQQHYLVFEDPSHAQQNILQSLAHRPDLGLEYEYNLLARQAFVSRPLTLRPHQFSEISWGPCLKAPSTFESLDLAIENLSPVTMPLFLQPEPANVRPNLSSAEASTLPFRDYTQLFNVGDGVDNSRDEQMRSQTRGFEPMLDDNVQGYGFDAALTDAPPIFNTIIFPDTTNTYLPPTGFASRTSSIGSIHSTQGRGRVSKILSRVSSSRSTADSMYSCFDSKSIQSGLTDTSTSSRRSRKAMDNVAKAAMKAVKAIGACWRCKLLRKQCNDQSPCESCPSRTSKSDWKLLGCRRGMLEENVLPVLLCPALPGNVPKSFEARSKDRDTAAAINARPQMWKKVTDNVKVTDDTKMVDNEAVPIGTLDSFLQAVDSELSNLNGTFNKFALSIGEQFSSALTPLDECIGGIIWILSGSEGLQKILGGFTMDSLTVLLRSASLYQAKADDDRLIAQSLICFKGCLEVLGLKQNGHLDGFSHLSCTRWIESTVCSINSIADLEANISQYMKELSRVFFQKEKMRKMRTWWLSVFYSLCIQNFVRKALLRLQIDVDTGTDTKDTSTGAKQYLHLALRLFLAYSRKYDPIMQKTPRDFGATMTPEDEMFSNHISIARLAVRQSSWEPVGINSSKDYLNLLLEDSGHKLH